MRNGQNKRMRGRNRKGGHHHHHQNPLSRMYESNGPDVKIRGTASHVGEKYLQLARDAQSSGDPVAAENYYQHAEHYFRLIAAAQEQLRQTQPYYQQQQQQPSEARSADEGYEDGDEQPQMGGEPFAPREPQPYYPREQQQHHNQQPHFQPQQPQQQHFQPRQQQQGSENDASVERLPSFITGNQPPQQQPQHGQSQQHGRNGPHGQNGPNGYDGPADRFPLHRRRRRHRGGGPREQGMDRQGTDRSAQGDDDGQPSGSHSADE
jgi:hypothetical protein